MRSAAAGVVISIACAGRWVDDHRLPNSRGLLHQVSLAGRVGSVWDERVCRLVNARVCSAQVVRADVAGGHDAIAGCAAEDRGRVLVAGCWLSGRLVQGASAWAAARSSGDGLAAGCWQGTRLLHNAGQSMMVASVRGLRMQKRLLQIQPQEPPSYACVWRMRD